MPISCDNSLQEDPDTPPFTKFPGVALWGHCSDFQYLLHFDAGVLTTLVARELLGLSLVVLRPCPDQAQASLAPYSGAIASSSAEEQKR